MPRRLPIDPTGTYHIGTRGSYGRPMFTTVGEHECFLRMYTRIARKYEWTTLTWVLMQNHHHFVVRLSDGGLSDGMRELHGGYSRWLNAMEGQTGKGHLVRHAFYARPVLDDADLIGTCAYVDLNPAEHRPTAAPLATDWCGYAATIGLDYPRGFHSPSLLLELFDANPPIAQDKYRRYVEQEHARRGHGPSPNDVTERG